MKRQEQLIMSHSPRVEKLQTCPPTLEFCQRRPELESLYYTMSSVSALHLHRFFPAAQTQD